MSTAEKKADIRPDVTLQPHQRAVVKRLRDEPRRLLLMHSLGSGKTLSALAAAEQLGEPYAVVAPASLRPNIQAEQAKFTTGNIPSRVLSYSELARDVPITERSIILDEVHRLRNLASKATQQVIKASPKAKQLILLSGTPVVNAPSDLATILSLLTDKVITPSEFTERYVGKARVSPGFLGWLRGVPTTYEPTIRRREELKELLKGKIDYYAPPHPTVPVTHTNVEVEMSPDQTRLYRSMWERLPWLLRWKLKRNYPMTEDELKRTRAFLSGPRQVGISPYPFMGEKKSPIKAFWASSKLQQARSMLLDKLKQDPRHKALVFSNFVDAGLVPYSAALKQVKVPHAIFHGGLSDAEKKRIIDDFNEGKLRVLLLGPAGTEGLNLRGVQLVQRLDPHWHSARGRQAAARGLRFGSHAHLPEELRHVEVQNFVSKLPLSWTARLAKAIGMDIGHDRRTTDDYLIEMSERKDRLNREFIELLKEIGADKTGAAASENTKTKTLWHGSPKRIKTLKPFPSALVGHPAVFATRDKLFATAMAAPEATGERIDVGFINGKMYVDELQPGALKYYDRPAYLYELPSTIFVTHPKLMPEEAVSKEPVKPIKRERVENILKALRDAGVEINLYADVPAAAAKRERKDSLNEKTAQKSALGIPDRTVYGDLGKLMPGQLVDWVVQQHLAERAGPHYDIRLGAPETGLYSWAVRKGLPGPGVKHLAVRQPLHEHGYKEFEGVIPSGQYGGGKVRLQDLGRVLITKISPDEVHFTVAHQRYPERYVLKQTKDDKWLLINTTKTDPIHHEKVRYTAVPADKVESIIRDLKPGTSVQAKIDGAASLARLYRDHAEIVSYRVSKETGWPIVHTERVFGGRPKIDIPPKLVGTVLRGELYGVDPKGKAIPPQILGGLLNAAVAKSIEQQKAKNVKLKQMVFDIQQIGKKPVSTETPYAERRRMIESVLAHLPSEVFHLPEEAKTPQEAIDLWRRIGRGEHPLTREGIIIHPPTGKPSKAKYFKEHDVYIREFFPGKGKYKGVGVGGFRYSHTPTGPIVGEIGTGLSDELRKDMFENPQYYIGRMARVKAQEMQQSGALRSPTLLSLHEDYPTARSVLS